MKKTMFETGMKKFLWLKKNKSTVLRTYVISYLKDQETIGTFYLKDFQKTNQKDFKVEKAVNRKSDKIHVK